MSEQKITVIGLPTYEEAARKVNGSGATALDIFIYENEPAGTDQAKFRRQLQAVMSEAEGRFVVQALYARLRGRCPYCDGGDVVTTGEQIRGTPGYRLRAPMECENCGAKWADIYSILRVESAGEDGAAAPTP